MQHVLRINVWSRIVRRAFVASDLLVAVVLTSLPYAVLQPRLFPAWSMFMDFGNIDVAIGTSAYAHCPPAGIGMCRLGPPAPYKSFVVWMIYHSRTPESRRITPRLVFVYPEWRRGF